MSTTNGHAKIMGMECPRCATWVDTPAELKEHFIDEHDMPITKADSQSLRAFAGTLERRTKKDRVLEQEEVVPETTVVPGDETPHHACPGCGTKIACMWETIARVDEQASRLKMIAAKMRNKQLGLAIGGPPRKNAEWTDEEAYAAYRSGLSVRAVSRMLGAATATIDKAIARAREKEKA